METTTRLQGKAAVLFFCIILSSNLYGQEYLRGFGIRVGGYAAYQAVTYKEFITPKLAVESVIGKNTSNFDRNISLQILTEYHGKIGRGACLNWYAGGGPSLMYWYMGSAYYNSRTIYTENGTKLRGALNTVLGLECKIGSWPLNVSLDFGPSITVYPYVQTNFMVNAGLRYTIKNTKFTAHHRLGKGHYKRGARHF